MNDPRNIRDCWLACIIVSVTSLASSPGLAEVAVVHADASDEVHSLYILQDIVDDPDPVGSTWIPYHPSTNGRVLLNPEGHENQDGSPSILLNPVSDLPLVAWSKNSSSGYDLVVSYFSEGSWAPPVVLADSASDELDPVLAVDPSDGTVHLLYWIHDSSPRVMHQQAPADLSSWSPPIQVSQFGEIACRPSAVFLAGGLHVVYEAHDFGYGATPRRIVLASWDGQSFDPVTVTTTQFTGPNWPHVHSKKGRLWIDWIEGDNEMNWVRQQASGGWEPVQSEGFAGAEDRDYHVRGRIAVQAQE
jgi:hypothetical protein